MMQYEQLSDDKEYLPRIPDENCPSKIESVQGTIDIRYFQAIAVLNDYANIMRNGVVTFQGNSTVFHELLYTAHFIY